MLSWMNKIKTTNTYHQIEKIVDKAILFAIVLLLFILIAEFFFQDFAHENELWLHIADWIVIGIFLLDLFFKYVRAKTFKLFLKHSWLDILAVFPFVLVFRLFEAIGASVLFADSLKTGQSILHETVELEKETVRIVQEVEKTSKLSRTSRFARFVRPITRMPRLIKAISFFDRPTKHLVALTIEETKKHQAKIKKAKAHKPSNKTIRKKKKKQKS